MLKMETGPYNDQRALERPHRLNGAADPRLLLRLVRKVGFIIDNTKLNLILPRKWFHDLKKVIHPFFELQFPHFKNGVSPDCSQGFHKQKNGMRKLRTSSRSD